MRPFSYCKLEIFLPASHLSPLETALRQVDAGHIGAYDSCLRPVRQTDAPKRQRRTRRSDDGRTPLCSLLGYLEA